MQIILSPVMTKASYCLFLDRCGCTSLDSSAPAISCSVALSLPDFGVRELVVDDETEDVDELSCRFRLLIFSGEVVLLLEEGEVCFSVGKLQPKTGCFLGGEVLRGPLKVGILLL